MTELRRYISKSDMDAKVLQGPGEDQINSWASNFDWKPRLRLSSAVLWAMRSYIQTLGAPHHGQVGLAGSAVVLAHYDDQDQTGSVGILDGDHSTVWLKTLMIHRDAVVHDRAATVHYCLFICDEDTSDAPRNWRLAGLPHVDSWLPVPSGVVGTKSDPKVWNTCTHASLGAVLGNSRAPSRTYTFNCQTSCSAVNDEFSSSRANMAAEEVNSGKGLNAAYSIAGDDRVSDDGISERKLTNLFLGRRPTMAPKALTSVFATEVSQAEPQNEGRDEGREVLSSSKLARLFVGRGMRTL